MRPEIHSTLISRQEVLVSSNQRSVSANKYPAGGEATDYCANDNMTAGALFGHLPFFV